MAGDKEKQERIHEFCHAHTVERIHLHQVQVFLTPPRQVNRRSLSECQLPSHHHHKRHSAVNIPSQPAQAGNLADSRDASEIRHTDQFATNA